MEDIEKIHEIEYTNDMEDIYCLGLGRSEINEFRLSIDSTDSAAQRFRNFSEQCGILCKDIYFGVKYSGIGQRLHIKG